METMTNPWFKRGTMFRHALDAPRMAAGSLTLREITDAIMTAWIPDAATGPAGLDSTP
jgi:hypothetical protein